MPYRVHLIEKRIERDSYADGCIGDEKITLSDADARPVVADTLADAVRQAFEAFGLPLDYFFVSDGGQREHAEFIGCNRAENDDGDEPTADERARFEQGEITLWLAEYTFWAQYVETRPVTRDELREAFPTATIE